MLALPPAPAPARPRMTMIATALVVAAATVLLGSLLATYLSVRDTALKAGQAWLPSGIEVPGVAANTLLVTMLGSSVMVQWAVYSIARDDRRNTYAALGLTGVFGAAAINAQAYIYRTMGVKVADSKQNPFGVWFYGITGAWIAVVLGGLAFIGVMAFRSLGGRYSGKDTEGIAAAALFWHFLTVACCAIWLAIYVTK